MYIGRLLYITPTDKPGWAFYKFSVGSCLQEQSAEGSNFFPHFFHLLKRHLLLQLLLLLGWCKGEVPAGGTDYPGARLPSLPPASNRGHASPCPGPWRGARGTHLKTWVWT